MMYEYDEWCTGSDSALAMQRLIWRLKRQFKTTLYFLALKWCEFADCSSRPMCCGERLLHRVNCCCFCVLVHWVAAPQGEGVTDSGRIFRSHTTGFYSWLYTIWLSGLTVFLELGDSNWYSNALTQFCICHISNQCITLKYALIK